MLGFTHQSRNTGNKFYINQPNFQPIIITNKLPKQVSPKRQQKVIKRIVQNNINIGNKKLVQNKNRQSKTKQSYPQNLEHRNQWSVQGTIKGAFDKNLRKNQLAMQQRKHRAQLKKEKQINQQEIIVNQKKIGSKSIKMMKQKDQQIQYLEQMIYKQKQQKAKIDKIYQQKKQQIEKQRQQLIELERRIQKQGIKQKKVIQEIKKIASPQKDISPQFIKSQGRQGNIQRQVINVPYQGNKFQEPTQSQALHQRNQLRQKQLQYLITQRQKCVKGLPNINYTPTLIPLLSKASYKIVSTHVSQIVQLLVDDLLEEQIYILEKIELQQAKQKEQRKAKQLMNDYFTMLDNFVQQNDEIADKVGKYSSMNFADVYKPKHYPQQQSKSSFQYDSQPNQFLRKLCLQPQFDDDHMQQITNRKQRYIRFVSNFDQYKKPNIQMFEKCTQQIIDEAIEKLAKQLDKGSGEFVDIVFRNEFK